MKLEHLSKRDGTYTNIRQRGEDHWERFLYCSWLLLAEDGENDDADNERASYIFIRCAVPLSSNTIMA